MGITVTRALFPISFVRFSLRRERQSSRWHIEDIEDIEDIGDIGITDIGDTCRISADIADIGAQISVRYR